MNSLEKMKQQRAELQKRHQELREQRKAATGFAAHEIYLEMKEVGYRSCKLGQLIRKAMPRPAGRMALRMPDRWIAKPGDFSAGKGKVRVKAQQKNPKPKRGQR